MSFDWCRNNKSRETIGIWAIYALLFAHITHCYIRHCGRKRNSLESSRDFVRNRGNPQFCIFIISQLQSLQVQAKIPFRHCEERSDAAIYNPAKSKFAMESLKRDSKL